MECEEATKLRRKSGTWGTLRLLMRLCRSSSIIRQTDYTLDFEILDLLDFLQHSAHGGRDPVKHSTGIMNQLQGVVS